MNHWVKCNIYTQTRKTGQTRLTTHLEKLKYLKNYRKGKKKDKYWKQYDEFISASKQMLDIITSDDRIKAQEKIWKIKMIESDYQFHRNIPLVPQVGYCSSTDNQWKRTEKRKLKEEKQLRKERENSDEHERTFFSVSSIDAMRDSADKKVTKKVI